MTGKALLIFGKLMTNHDQYRELDYWADIVDEWTPIFVDHARLIGKSEILEVALSMAEILHSANKSPMQMLAVAVDLIERNFSLNKPYGWGVMRFHGWQDMPAGSRMALFNLLRPLGQHPEGSTITTVTARALMRDRREIGE